MKCSILLIFCIISCFGMEEYSRLELLPTDLKMGIIKQIIARAPTRKHAIAAMRVFVIADRLLRKHNNYPAYQTTIEDHLGWYWNNQRPMSFIPDTFICQLFETLPEQCLSDSVIKDPELCQSQQNFAHFCKLVKEKKIIPPDILNAIDLYHCYVTQEPYQDTTLGSTWIKERTPLYVATDANDETTVERLLQQGCDTQKLSDTDMNPLHVAAKKNYKGIVALLIQYKAPLNAQTRIELKTAMHLAAENGHMDIMHMLVRAGAGRNIKNRNGYTASQCILGRILVG